MGMMRRAPGRASPWNRTPFAHEIMARVRGLSPLNRWVGILALLFIVGIILVAVFAPLLAPYPSQGLGNANVQAILLPPSHVHPFGTDEEGRDILSRVMFGARPDLLAAFLVVGLAVLVGVVIGGAAGYIGGPTEMLLMRITDFFLAFPSLLLAMVVSLMIGPSLFNTIVALAVSWWPWYARLVHAWASYLRWERYVVAASIAGVRRPRILVRHIIPNAMTPVFVQAASDIGNVLIAAAALSYLGLGVQPPQADWGSMVMNGQQFILAQWWYVTFPGLAIFLTAIAFNLFGDSLKDLFDPSRRRF